MVSFEDPAVPDFMDIELEKPMALKIDATGRPVYQSRSDWGVWPIQPDPYRAPEVILGNGWQMEADIWNIGVLLWDLITGKPLFRHIHDQEGRYDPELHIAEIIALLGLPPTKIIKRYHVIREYPWPEPVKREDGTVCETAEDFFCGPFFDSNGRSLHEHLIPGRKLDDAIPFLEGEEKESFLDLARGMLVWHPNL
ncbi:kinase-like protein [Penicillium malachiteum]|uniref:Kinase-like protein n=1 Tax=Penicillium malachiteum TaxID=1324776 RepID=A0AAD6HPB5_9EURO|nr:kinase-like protein [Penicillium malachiteum]